MRKNPQSKITRRTIVEPLEARVLFSADLLPSIADVNSADSVELQENTAFPIKSESSATTAIPDALLARTPQSSTVEHADTQPDSVQTETDSQSIIGDQSTSPHELTTVTLETSAQPTIPTDDQEDMDYPAREHLEDSVEYVFIDSSIANADTLLSHLREAASTDTYWRVVTLDAGRDGVDQITEALISVSGVDAVHLISHGRDGEILLGDTTLSAASFGEYSADIWAWGQSLDADADLLIYGCNLASTDTGKELIELLAEGSHSDVAASDDPTGHNGLGGDWVLEYQHGTVSTDVAFNQTAQQDWHGTLDISSVLSAGIKINTDKGNDTYLYTTNGDVLLGGRSQFTLELAVQFDASPDQQFASLLHYAAAGSPGSNSVSLVANFDNTLTLSIENSTVTSIAADHSLFDGETHTISVSWSNNNGEVSFYVDGTLLNRHTGLHTGQLTNDGGGNGTIYFGQTGRDTTATAFDDNGFSGTYHDVRIWNNLQSGSEIDANRQHKLSLTPVQSVEAGLLANWQMDGFNTNGQITDLVSGNNLSAGHANNSAVFINSTPADTLSVNEQSVDGTRIGFVKAHAATYSNDIISDGLFLSSGALTQTTYNAGQTFGDWRVVSGSIDIQPQRPDKGPLGGEAIDLDGATFGGAISQTLTTIPGAEYQVVFALSASGTAAAYNQLRVSAAGTSEDFTIETDPDWSATNNQWQQRTFSFIAQSAATDLTFSSLSISGSAGPVITDVNAFEIPDSIARILQDDSSLHYNAATGKFYKFNNTQTNWHNATALAAQDMINSVPGNLVTVRSDAEQNYLVDLMTDNSVARAWAGGSDLATEGTWIWHDGSNDTFYHNGSVDGAYHQFSATEPNGVLTENSLEIIAAGNHWNDLPPGNTNKFIIEWDARTVTNSFTYELSDNAGGRFSIHPHTGELIVASGSQLNYSVDNFHNITINATDASGHTTSKAFTVLVNDTGPTELAINSATRGGLIINNDGGNDNYLISDDGSAIVGGLTQFTFETQFKTSAAGTEIPLLSYATDAHNNELLILISGGGQLTLIAKDSFAGSFSTDFSSLADGKQHSFSLTYDLATGIASIYIDGSLVETKTNIAPLSAIDTGGALVFAQEQDSVDGSYSTSQVFKGTLYNTRLFSEIRSSAEIASAYRTTLPHNENGLLAQWNFSTISSEHIVEDNVHGNHLTLKQTSQSGFTQSSHRIDLTVAEGSAAGTVIGTVRGTDINRQQLITDILASDSDLYYHELSGKFYQYVDNGGNWHDINVAALNATLNGVSGQLAAVTSADVNQLFVDILIHNNASQSYIRASDHAQEGEWRLGEQRSADLFWRGNTAGQPAGDAYSNWDSSNPNNFNGQDYARVMALTGLWDDVNGTGSQKYFIEYNADDVLDNAGPLGEQPLTYSVVSQSMANAFAIDPDNGTVSVANDQQLDHETLASHNLLVRSTDRDGNSTDQGVIITVTNIAEENTRPVNLSSGIQLNNSGGNNTHLITGNGDTVLGGLTQFTIESDVAIQNSNRQALLSYSTDTHANALQLIVERTGLVLTIADTSLVLSGADYHRILSDGDKHSLAVSWNNSSGSVLVYLDGKPVDSASGFNAGVIIDSHTSNALIVGMGSNSPTGSVQHDEVFRGTFYDLRIWDHVKSDIAVVLNHNTRIDPNSIPDGLQANWQMNSINGLNQVTDVVGGANLTVSHASGPQFVDGSAVQHHSIDEYSAAGTSAGYAIPTSSQYLTDVVNDGKFTYAAGTGPSSRFYVDQSIGDWTVVAGEVDLLRTTVEAPPAGGFSIDLSGSVNGAISQTLNTEPGRQYQLIYSLSGQWDGGPDIKPLRVSVGGESTDVLVAKPADWSADNMLWESRSVSFTADSSTTPLLFSSTVESQYGPVIANVQMVELPDEVDTLLREDSSLSFNAATGKFYRFVDTPTEFNTALANATAAQLNNINGQLVTIKSNAENELLQQLAINSGSQIWLGASDAVSPGNWAWLEGSVESAHTFWTGGDGGSSVQGYFANNYGLSGLAGENFLRIRSDGIWHDDVENSTHSYVIEWDMLDVLGHYTYSLTDPADQFQIDEETGEITVRNGQHLDYEAQSSYPITVSVTNAVNETYTKDITVHVNNNGAELSYQVPVKQAGTEDTPITFSTANGNTIRIDDQGPSDAPMQVTLSVNNGVLTLAQITDVSFIEGANSTALMVLQGSESAINSALDGLQYTPAPDYNGVDTLSVFSNVASDLTTLYRFDTDANDTSAGSINTGTLQNGAQIITDPVRGQVLALNGINDFVESSVANNQAPDITLAAWLNANNSDADLISLDGAFSIRIDDATRGGFVTARYFDGSSYQNATSTASVSGAGWHHVAASFHDGSKTLKLYIDGTEVASETYSSSIDYSSATSNTIFVGSSSGISAFFGGLVDDIRVYERTLTTDEISTLAGSKAPDMIGADPNHITATYSDDNFAQNSLFIHDGFNPITTDGVISSIQIPEDPDNTPINFDLLILRPDGTGEFEVIHRVTLSDSDIQTTHAGTRTLDTGRLEVRANDVSGHWTSQNEGFIPYVASSTGGASGWSDYTTANIEPGSSVQAGLTATEGRIYDLSLGFQPYATITTDIALDIEAVNDSPVLTINPGDELHLEGSAGTLFDDALSITDLDTSNFNGATLTTTVTTNAESTDQLSIHNNTSVITTGDFVFYNDGSSTLLVASTSGGTASTSLVITFNNNATLEAIEAIARQVSFGADTENPSQLQRVLQMEVTDGQGGTSAVASKTIDVLGVNDAPDILSLHDRALVVENNGISRSIVTGLDSIINDPDTPTNLDTGTLTVTGTNFTTGDTLQLDTSNLISLPGGYGNGAPIHFNGTVVGVFSNFSDSGYSIAFNANATTAIADALINATLLSSTSDQQGLRGISITLNDGDGTLNGGLDTSSADITVFVVERSGAVATTEDSPYSFHAEDFYFTGTIGNHLSGVTVLSLPAAGTLLLNGTPLAVDSTITRAQLDSRAFTFRPDVNENGNPYAVFDFQVQSTQAERILLPGYSNSFTFSGGLLKDAEAILDNPDNFSPAGAVTNRVIVGDTSNDTTTEYLAGGQIMFSGWVPDGGYSPTELDNIDDWVHSGGILVATSDDPGHDDISSYYGLVVQDSNNSSWVVTDTSNPVINGAFGLVGHIGDTIQATGTIGSFDPASTAAGDLILARDSVTRNPTIILREHGDGYLLFTSDEGIFRTNLTGNGLIQTTNDRLVANIFSWASDETGTENTHQLLIEVTPVNDTPVLSSIDDTSLSYNEDAGPVLVTSSLVVSDIDSPTIASATVSITGNFAGSQDQLHVLDQNGINGLYDDSTGILSLSGDATLDDYTTALQSVSYENTSNTPDTANRTITFRVYDGESNSNVQSRTINVNPVNDAPVITNIEPTGATFVEAGAPVFVSSTLLMTDADDSLLESATVIISANLIASEDNLHFTDQNGISGNYQTATGTLTLTGSSSVANYEAAIRSITYTNSSNNPDTTNRTVSIVVSDATAASNTVTREIGISALDNTPELSAIEPGPVLYIENGSPLPITETISASDPDTQLLQSALIKISTNHQPAEDRLEFISNNIISGVFDASRGELSLSGSATVAQYQAALRSITYENSSDDPDTNVRTVTYSVNDGNSNSDPQTREITVTPVNDAPELASVEFYPLQFPENSAAQLITSGITISDDDNSHLQSLILRISGNYSSDEDRLNFSDQGGITGSFDLDSGTLTLSGVATVENYQTAIRSVTYTNLSDNPNTTDRTMTISVDDGNANSDQVTRDIIINPENDAPVIQGVEQTAVAYTENSSPIIVSQTLSLSDVDNTTLHSATVSITDNFSTGEDVLQIAAQSGIVSSFDGSTGILQLTGEASVYEYQTALRSVTYSNISENPAVNSRQISFTVNDDQHDSNTQARVLAVTGVNDAALASIENTTLQFTENSLPIPVTSHLLITDSDSTYLLSATVTLGASYVADEDILRFSDTATLTSYWDTVTGTLTINGSDTLDAYQSALRSITYQNTSDNPDASSRQVYFSINDGSDDSLIVSRNISITPINDAPATNTLENQPLLFTENFAPIPLTSTVVLSDVDHETLAAALIRINTNFNANEDILLFSSTPTISGIWDSTKGELLLSGIDTIQAYEDAIRSITYVNTSDAPTISPRFVSITVSDGDYDSQVVSREINVSPVNDPPIASQIESTPVFYTENKPPVQVSETIELSDVDNTHFISAQVTIISGYHPNEDLLNFVSTTAITGTWDVGTGTLTLAGFASADAYQEAMRSIAYSNTSDNPTLNARTLEFLVNDDNASSHSVYRDLLLTSVNDQPSGVDTIVSMLEDTDYQLRESDFGFSDVLDEHNFSAVVINQLPAAGKLLLNGAPVSLDQTISIADIIAGKLVFQPQENANGALYDSFSFRVTDDGGTDQGGQNTSAPHNFSFNVINVNDAPRGSDNTVVTTEDTEHTFARADFRFSDPLDNNNFSAITISALPAAGALTIEGDNAYVGQIITVAQIDSGHLIYTPPANGNNSAYNGFAFQVHDDGGLLNGGIDVDQIPDFISFNVPGVNDAPRLSLETATVDEGSNQPITTDFLSATDADDQADELFLTLTQTPRHGLLLLNGKPLDTGESFTLAQIAGDSLRYLHDGSETESDFFLVSLIDGGEDGVLPVSGRFSLTINEVIDPAPELDNDSLFLKFGQKFNSGTGDVLDSGSSLLSKGAVFSNSELTLTIESPPQHGTIEINQDGTFSYTHDGSEYLIDEFSYRVTNVDGQFSIASVSISVEPALQEARAIDTTSSTEVLEKNSNEKPTEKIEAEVDEDNTPEWIEFEIPEPDFNTDQTESDDQEVLLIKEIDIHNSHPGLNLNDETLAVKQHKKLRHSDLIHQQPSISRLGFEVVFDVYKTQPHEAVANPFFLEGLAQLESDLQQSEDRTGLRYTVATDAILGVSISATAGVLAWALRGGAIFASFMATTPLWASLDPIRALTPPKGTTKSVESPEDQSVENLFK